MFSCDTLDGNNEDFLEAAAVDRAQDRHLFGDFE